MEAEAWAMIPVLDEKGSGCVLKMIPITLCRNCVYGELMFSRKPEEKQCVCCKHGMDVTPEWFCADGKKRP